jgi:GNAT superfamily N-acetyltransferase
MSRRQSSHGSADQVTPLEAASELATLHGLRHDRMAIVKDGSNLLVHLAPAPVILRIASFTALIRGDPLPYLEREVSLVSYLASVGAQVMPLSDLMPPGPHVVGGWAMSAWAFVDHEPGAVPGGLTSFQALDVLHEAMRGYPGELPLLNPAGDDLDRAIRFGADRGVISPAQAADLRGRRDAFMAELLAVAPEWQALHGDAFPRNSLLTPGGVVWIDFEDCCSGPVLWDLATLIRQGGGEPVAKIVRARYGLDAVQTAIALRQVQVDVWTILHDGRATLGWSPLAMPALQVPVESADGQVPHAGAPPALRRAADDDSVVIRDLVVAAYSKYIPLIGRTPLPMLTDFAQAVRVHDVWVLDGGEAIVGVIELVNREDHLWVDNVAIAPGWQGRGLGRRLIGHAEDEARRLRLPEIRLLTNERYLDNIAMYTRYGYRETHREPYLGTSLVYFAKQLDGGFAD